MAFAPWKIIGWVADGARNALTFESLVGIVGAAAVGGLPGAAVSIYFADEAGNAVREASRLAFDATLETLKIGEDLWNRIPGELISMLPTGTLLMFRSGLGAPGPLLLLGPGGLLQGIGLYDRLGERIEEAVVEIADLLGAFETRELTDGEWGVAERVFGESLPPRHTIYVTNIGFGNDRPFVFPLFRNHFMVNLGSMYHGTSDLSISDPALLAHELTHVWQARFRPTQLTYYADAIQREYDFSYGRQWWQYGLEQQGRIVEEWVQSGENVHSPLFRYIRDNIRPGAPRSNSRLVFNMATGRGIRELFNACNGYSNTSGLGAVFPNLHHVHTDSERSAGTRAGARFGTIQLRPGATTWMDLPVAAAASYRSRDTGQGIRERFTGVHDWATHNGFVGGFPNLHQITVDRVRVGGVFLLDSSAAEWRDLRIGRDVPDIPGPRDSPRRIVRRFNDVHDYAVREGFVGGFPNLHETRSGRAGAVLVRHSAGSWADVSVEDLLQATGW